MEGANGSGGRFAGLPFADFIKHLGELPGRGRLPELRSILQEIKTRLQADACVLWEPSLDFAYVPESPAGKIYAIDSTLVESKRIAHSAVPADPIHDFSARFLRGNENIPWHNSFPQSDFRSPSHRLMSELGFSKVCVAGFESPSVSEGPDPPSAPSQTRGLISLYRKAADPDFTEREATELNHLASFVSPLYRILNDRQVLGLFHDVRQIFNAAEEGASDKPWQALDQVSERIRQTFRCREVSIFLRHPEGSATRFRLLGTTYNREDLDRESYVGRKSEGLTGWVLHERKSVLIPDLTRFQEQRAEIQKIYRGIQWNNSGGVFDRAPDLFALGPGEPLPPISFMASPIQSGGELLGCIRCAIGTDPYYFSQRELSILENIAAYVAETWKLLVTKEIWHSLLRSLGSQTETFHAQAITTDFDRGVLYGSMASAITREHFRGCQIVVFRTLESTPHHSEKELMLRAVEAAPEVYSAEEIARLIALPRRFPVKAGVSTASRLMRLDDNPGAIRKFNLNTEGDREEQEFFKAARHVLSTAIQIDDQKYGTFELAFSRPEDLDDAAPYLEGFMEIFGRNLALQEARAGQHRRFQELLVMQTESYAHVSHQLRSPVNAAVMRLDLMVRRLRRGDGLQGFQIEKELPSVLGQCRKAFRVTSTLDLFAKISRGEPIRAEVQSHPLGAIRKILIESLLDHRYTFGRWKNIDFDAESFDIWRTKHDNMELRFDSNLTEQVIDAVVGNAFKYSNRGETVRVLGRMESRSICLDVISCGLPLSVEETQLCRTKFWRSPKARDRNRDGSGLGLYLTSMIMTAQGGEFIPHATTDGSTRMTLQFSAHPSLSKS